MLFNENDRKTIEAITDGMLQQDEDNNLGNGNITVEIAPRNLPKGRDRSAGSVAVMGTEGVAPDFDGQDPQKNIRGPKKPIPASPPAH